MKIKTLITVTLLGLSLAMAAQGQVVSQAYEVSLVNFRAPVSENGATSFKECGECTRRLIRVTPATRYTISGRAVRFADFRDMVGDANNRPYAAVTVLHHLESDTIESINVSL